jgi:ATPase subunit of ABC transporter with duplicated ATPase domains
MRAQLVGVTMHHGGQVVLDGASLAVGPRARIGLVGPNGVGKSTVLRLLAGEEVPDGGAVVLDPPDLTVAHMPQEHDARPGETLLERLARRTGIAAAERELEAAAATLADGDDGGAAGRYDRALSRFLALGGGDLESRAAKLCNSLRLGVDLGRPLDGLSGGEAGRASLAAALLARADLLLLDEPTNDLDADGLERLEAFVASYPGAVVLVSHDRAFLDASVDRVAEIDPRSRRIVEWSGGWSEYAERRDAARAAAYDTLSRAQERRRELTTLLSSRRTEARAGGAAADRRGTHALMTKVRQAERLLERNPLPEKPFEPWELRLELRSSGRVSAPAARLDRAVVARATMTVGPLNLEVQPGERVAVTGRNGSGKTTLLQALLGELALTSGTRALGRGAVPGVITQERRAYTSGEPLHEAFVSATGLTPVDARTLLAKFGLGADHVSRSCATLSPGERTRAHLAELQAAGVNLLVLDEPTNHLDLEAVEQLEQALAGYDGTLLVVSHDRRFLEAVAPTRFVSLDPPAPGGSAGDGDPEDPADRHDGDDGDAERNRPGEPRRKKRPPEDER